MLHKRKSFSLFLLFLLSASMFFSLSVIPVSALEIPNITYIGSGDVRFSFVIVTDIHDDLERLDDLVKWVNTNRDTHKIRFVMVLGDLFYCKQVYLAKFPEIKRILDTLDVPYMPLIGNHEVADPAGGFVPDPLEAFEKAFNDCFEELFSKQGSVARFPEFERAHTPVRNEEVSPKRDSYFQNYAFDIVGDGWRYHFVCLDFCCRKDDGWGSDWYWGNADLHGFFYWRYPGTFQWLIDHLDNYFSKYPYMKGDDEEKADHVFLFSHHPPSRAVFGGTDASGDYSKLIGSLMTYQDAIGYWFAGHTHMGEEYDVKRYLRTLCKAVVTDSLKDDRGHFRVVKVCTPSGEINDPPIADAGPDQTISFKWGEQKVQLDGSGSSDPEDHPFSYHWEFVSTPLGATPVLQPVESIPQPYFYAEKPGVYTLKLEVKDDIGWKDFDEVNVTVLKSLDLALEPREVIDLEGEAAIVNTHWHELHPDICHSYTLTSWEPGRVLGPSDVIDMNLTGSLAPPYSFEVDEVTVNLRLTQIGGAPTAPPPPLHLDYKCGYWTFNASRPLWTKWNEIKPNPGICWRLEIWEDTNGDSELSAGDRIGIKSMFPNPRPTLLFDVDSVTVGLKLTRIPGITVPIDKFPPYYLEFKGTLGEFQAHDYIHNPVSTEWLEIWPDQTRIWNLSWWQDSSFLSPSDQIGLTSEGPVLERPRQYHVDKLTVAMWLSTGVSGKAPEVHIVKFEGSLEQFKKYHWHSPNSTQWHEVNPEHCRQWHLTSWDDRNTNDIVDPSDAIIMMDMETGVQEEFIVDDLSTDIIVTLKTFDITASPSSNEATQGEAVSFTVDVGLVYATPTAVTLSLSGLPAGATYTFTPLSGDPPFTSTLHVTTSTETPAGTYVLTITGASEGVSRSTPLQLVIKEKTAEGLPTIPAVVVAALAIVVIVAGLAVYLKRGPVHVISGHSFLWLIAG